MAKSSPEEKKEKEIPSNALKESFDNAIVEKALTEYFHRRGKIVHKVDFVTCNFVAGNVYITLDPR